MKFQYCSDLHLEFYPDDYSLDSFLTPSAPILIVAGDLCQVEHPNFKRFFDTFSIKFKYILYISGNHEYYSNKHTPMTYINKSITQILNEYSNVIYLNNKKLVIGSNGIIDDLAEFEEDSIIILGTTLWSEITNPNIQYYISDYAEIFNQNRKFVTPSDISYMFDYNKNWLQYILSEVENTNRKFLIITHHLPSFTCIDSKYKGNPMNCAFASDLDELIKLHPQIKFWVCGHTHTSFDKTVGQSNILCNPLGYTQENNQYDLAKVFEI